MKSWDRNSIAPKLDNQNRFFFPIRLTHFFFLPSCFDVSHDPGNVFVLHLDVVAGGVRLELTGAAVVGDPQAVAALVQVQGGVPVQRDPVVVATHPIGKSAFLVAAVN